MNESKNSSPDVKTRNEDSLVMLHNQGIRNRSGLSTYSKDSLQDSKPDNARPATSADFNSRNYGGNGGWMTGINQDNTFLTATGAEGKLYSTSNETNRKRQMTVLQQDKTLANFNMMASARDKRKTHGK